MLLATMIIGAMIRVDSAVIIILSMGVTQNRPANIEVKTGDGRPRTEGPRAMKIKFPNMWPAMVAV